MEVEARVEKKENSAAVGIVFEQIRDLMRMIRDVDWIEKQQEMAMQLFKFLWNAKSLEDVATKLLKLALKKDEKEANDDNEKDDGLEDLYLE